MLYAVAISGYRRSLNGTTIQTTDSLDAAFAKIKQKCDEKYEKIGLHRDAALAENLKVLVYEAALEIRAGMTEKTASQQPNGWEARNRVQTDPRAAEAMKWIVGAVNRDGGPVELVCYYTHIGPRTIEGRWSLACRVDGLDAEPKYQGYKGMI